MKNFAEYYPYSSSVILKRLRSSVFVGILILLVIIASLSITFFWPDSLPYTSSINIRCALVIGCTLLGGIFILIINFIKTLETYTLNTKKNLYRISHTLRDYQSQIYRIQKDLNQKEYDLLNIKSQLTEMVRKICEGIQNFYSDILNDDSLAVAIRLATLQDNGKNSQIVYKTFARSTNLNLNRNQYSEGVPINHGIPRFFQDRNNEGVLIINDLIEASKFGLYKLTRSDHYFPDEIVSIAVTPMKSWDGNEESVIGLLYLTSRKRAAFSYKDVDLILFIANTISSWTSFAVNSFAEILSKKK